MTLIQYHKVGKILVPFLLFLSVSFTQAQMMIYEMYPGGGNTGAVYNNDFIVLFNSGSSAQSLNGWSVQYASATATGTWDVLPLNDVNLAAGAYYLIELPTSGNIGASITGVDQTAAANTIGNTSAIAVGGGKLALFNSTTAFTGTSPIGNTNLVDFVGYGNANAYEGTAAAPGMSNNSTIIYRANGNDTNVNSTDFAKNMNLSQGTFPIQLVYFKGISESKAIKIYWETASETNGAQYVLQKSKDAKHFEVIAHLAIKNDLAFQFIDEKPFSGQNYYQLLQVDFDGRESLSQIISVYWEQNHNFVNIYPNPLQYGDVLHIDKAESVQLSGIYNLDKAQAQTINNQYSLKPGTYIFKFRTPNNSVISKKVRIN